MIGRLRGIILEKQLPLILIEVNGVGYEVHVPTTCFYKLPEIGKEAIVFTQFLMYRDVQLLYGFNSVQERMLFRVLIKANGIGPKLALEILSSMSAEQFINAVESEDLTSLLQLTGVGKKTASRLIVEMKDRVMGLHSTLCQAANREQVESGTLKNKNFKQEAVAALIALGYKYQEANIMVSKVSSMPDTSSETLIREALRTVL